MFRNEPLTAFGAEDRREALHKALAALDRTILQGGLKACPVINGEEIQSTVKFRREDPGNTEVLVGVTDFATLEHVTPALACIRNALDKWRSTSVASRADVLKQIARIMRKRRCDLTALLIREVGKSWKEADGEVAEAIDFCEYYAEEAVRLIAPRTTAEIPGEESIYAYEPRGVCIVISPWNFPLAISCGMTVAALVTGNGVVLKPAEQTSLITFELAKILLEAGIPAEIFAFLPGYGEEVGSALVNSPHVDMICFTGSKQVGLEIVRRAAVVHPEQRNVKRVVAEMGGKNAIIVDQDADQDEALKGIIQSAFGFSGQKCSACSRVIVVGSAFESFVKRLSDAVGDLLTGQASDPATFVGPLIDREAHERVRATIKRAQMVHKLVTPETSIAAGYFVAPAVFRDVDVQSEIWREEIFGPVLAVRQASSFSEALALANDSQYALTGAVFSRNPENIQTAKNDFRVGNLYINRSCTGAMVCRHPFGGSRMSGVGSKAGGPDYLVQFLEPRTITENTVRRGFAPET